MVATFEQVTHDFGRVMKRFNQRFNTHFSIIDHTPEKEADLFQKGRVHLSPSSERQEIKLKLMAELAELQDSKLMQQARLMHQRFSDYAEL